MHRVAVAVLNWNQYDRTLACLDALERSRGVEIEPLVVDNASAGDDVEHLRGRLGADRVLVLPENRGYAGGMNAALEWWAAQGTDAPVLLITPDATVTPDAVREMAAVLRTHPRAGAVGPLVVYRERPHRLVGAGGRLDPDRIRAPLLRAPERDSPYAVDWIDGCCMMLRPDAVAAVGGFDERYFAYFEETDFCHALQKAGWSVMLTPGAVVHHPKEEVLRPPYFYYYMARNRLLFWSKNFGVSTPRLAASLAAVSAHMTGSLVKSLLLPPLWLESPDRFRRLIRQVRGAAAGLRDHLRGRYGAMPPGGVGRKGAEPWSQVSAGGW